MLKYLSFYSTFLKFYEELILQHRDNFEKECTKVSAFLKMNNINLSFYAAVL